MTMTTLSICIPTPGRGRPLRRCLISIATQPLYPGDEVLVAGDTTDGPLPDVEDLVKDFGPQFHYLPVAGTIHQLDDGVDCHSYGHDQLNAAMAAAKGDYLLAQDDDDVYVRGAFAAVRGLAASLSEPRPMMFRFVTRFRTLLWATPEVRYEWIGGHNLVLPNRKDRLGQWTSRYQGDFDWVRSSLDKWPGGDADIVWDERVLSFARPDAP